MNRIPTRAEQKQMYIRDIMSLLSYTYQKENGVYKTVEKSLNKLNCNELSGMFSMVVTSSK